MLKLNILNKNKYQIKFKLGLISCLCTITFGSFNIFSQQTNNKNIFIEKKVDSLLAIMTLDEKMGQMSQVRHFADITDEDIATKFIGSVIHTQGPTPGEDAAGWQARFITLQKIARF